MKIYVASHDRLAATHAAHVLSIAGHTITSRWHEKEFFKTEEHTVEERLAIASEDFEDVTAADALVLIAGPDRYSGGKFVEAGIAIGQGKPVVIIGRRENMLMWLPEIIAVDTPEMAATTLLNIERRTPTPSPQMRAVSDDLRKRIMIAIFDPGASEGFKGDRDLTTWQTDAVVKVLNETLGGTGDDCSHGKGGVWPPLEGASNNLGNDSLSVVTAGETAPSPQVPLRELDRLNGEAGVRKINDLLDRLDPTPATHAVAAKECDCFGDSGLHASTHVPVGSDREHCDLCGYPVQADTTDILSAINNTPAHHADAALEQAACLIKDAFEDAEVEVGGTFARRLASEIMLLAPQADGFNRGIMKAAAMADEYAVNAERQAATTKDGVTHDGLLVASDFCELLAGEIRALATAAEGK